MQLSGAKWLFWPETKALIAAFGLHPVRFVGGGVRDSLLDIPINDIDLATILPPEAVMQQLAQAGIKAIPTGIEHGTVTAVIGRHHFEITTLRRDVSTDGRRATVAYSTDWREDAARRDFTMNALYCDINGVITDYFNGIQDTLAGRVRFIGQPEERIREDALRILRFFRFLAYYGKEEPAPDALAACAKQADMIEKLSGERIQQEMLKLLVAGRAADTIELMQPGGILSHVIPATVSTRSLKRLPFVLDKTSQPSDPVLALALLLRTSGEDVSGLSTAIASRWKLSKAHYRLLADLCRCRVELCGDVKDTNPTPPFNKSLEKAWKKHIRVYGGELFVKQVLLLMAEGEDEKAGLQALQLAEQWDIPAFPLTGDDLIKHGVVPGKELGYLLSQLEQYWEEQDYRPEKEELLTAVQKAH